MTSAEPKKARARAQGPAPLPKTVKCGSLVYRIAVGGHEWALAQVAAGSDEETTLFGHTMNESCVIALRPDLPLCMERSTLMHECYHAMSAATGGIVDRLDKEAGGGMEEAIASIFGEETTQLLRDNPALVAYLTGE